MRPTLRYCSCVLSFAALALAALAPVRAQAQRGPEAPAVPGYVVTSEGDTLRGLVEDRIDLAKARAVAIRSTADAEWRVFSPEEARTYAFDDGGRFVSRTVSPHPDSTAEPAFLRVLVGGPLNLYLYAYQPGEERYYVEGDAFPLEGLYRYDEEVVDWEYNRSVRTRNLYVGTLARAFRECDQSRNAASRVAYTTRSLSRAVIAYNACVDPGYEEDHDTYAFARRGRTAAHFRLRTGVDVTQAESSRGSHANGYTPVVGAGVEVAFLNTGQTSALGSVVYRRIATGLFGASGIIPYTSGVVSFSVGGKYGIPTSAGTPYLSAEYLFGWVVGPGDPGEAFPDFGIFEPRVYAPNVEGGVALEVGFERQVFGDHVLGVGLRGEMTSMQQQFIYVPGAEPLIHRRAGQVVVGLRF